MKKVCFIMLVTISCCTHSTIATDPMSEMNEEKIKFSYLALGDSYTIGQGVPAMSSFPILLEKKLIQSGYTKEKDIQIIAKTGWTCDDLLKNIASSAIQNQSFDLVTLLIGVNDQYQGIDIDQYPARFTLLVNQAIRISGSSARVVILSIPDYSVTPFGGNSSKIAKEIAEYNTINRRIAEASGIKYVDITGISLKAKGDLSYLASDRLHPSEKMYSEWVELMYPEVLKALKQ